MNEPDQQNQSCYIYVIMENEDLSGSWRTPPRYMPPWKWYHCAFYTSAREAKNNHLAGYTRSYDTVSSELHISQCSSITSLHSVEVRQIEVHSSWVRPEKLGRYHRETLAELFTGAKLIKPSFRHNSLLSASRREHRGISNPTNDLRLIKSIVLAN